MHQMAKRFEIKVRIECVKEVQGVCAVESSRGGGGLAVINCLCW